MDNDAITTTAKLLRASIRLGEALEDLRHVAEVEPRSVAIRQLVEGAGEAASALATRRFLEHAMRPPRDSIIHVDWAQNPWKYGRDT